MLATCHIKERSRVDEQGLQANRLMLALLRRKVWHEYPLLSALRVVDEELQSKQTLPALRAERGDLHERRAGPRLQNGLDGMAVPTHLVTIPLKGTI